ncbi:MAG TPA: hypothetical protein VFT70_09915 [Nocardioides sp.]|nr:hypothetical protein [Nocardioides sp.]
MNTIYPMYPEAARHEVDRRLRDATDERRRVPRRRLPSTRRAWFRTSTMAA